MTSDAHRALTLLATHPGELDAEALGRHLWPPPRLTGTESYLEWRKALPRHVAVSTRRAGRLLGRLVEAGLVEKLRPPVVAEWFAASVAKHGLHRAMWRAHPSYPCDVPELSGLCRLYRQVDCGPGLRVKSGAAKRCLSRLVEMDVLVPSTRRWVTAEGAEVVRGVAVLERGAA